MGDSCSNRVNLDCKGKIIVFFLLLFGIYLKYRIFLI